MSIAAVILTRNEEDCIGAALDSVAWCDEVFVVDSRSIDHTRAIAERHGASIIDIPRPAPDEPYDHLRLLGVEASSTDLVLLLDADERLSTGLQAYLQETDVDQDIKLIRAPVLNYVGNELLVRGWPRFKTIIVRRDAVGFDTDVHDFLRIDGKRVDELETEYIHDVPATHDLAVHHNLADSVHDRWVAQRRYARIAGTQRSFSPFKLLLGPPWGFYHRVIEHRGWRDGLLGIGLGLCYSWFLFETQVRAGIRWLRER